MLLGQLVHPRAGGEVRGVLGAAVEHDHQWHRLAGEAGRNVEVVGPRPGRVGVGEVADLATGRAGRSRRGGTGPGGP